jgi:transcription-repair coupling factor (superfamily II helicase)
VQARACGVLKVDAGAAPDDPHLPAQPALRRLPHHRRSCRKSRHFRLAGNDKLRIDREIAEPRERAQFVRDILRGLMGPLR